jgi:hypothetical protein
MNGIKKKKKLKKTAGPSGGNTVLNQQRIASGIKAPKLKKTKVRNTNRDDIAAQQYIAGKQGKSFVEALDPQSLEYFNEVCARPFAEQAQFFLNAFWDEFSDHAECVYDIHWKTIRNVEMESKGIQYVHLYEEGFDLDFDMGLLLFERLNYLFENNRPEDAKTYPLGVPVHMTSITRKKELRSKVDVNFDGRVGFLEYLLYQFKASPKTLMERSTRSDESNPELDAARAALAEVNKRIKAYEAEKARLQKIAEKGKGVKALGAVNMLAQIESGPLMEQLRAALITAEAKVRIVAKKYKLKASGGGGGAGEGQPRTEGTVWWMKREIQEKKKLYGRKKK